MTVNGKSRSPHNIFQNALPTFFVLPIFTKLGSKIPFQKKSSSAQLMLYVPSIPSPSLRHLDSNFSDRAKGLSMSCDRQRQKSESAQHSFFKTHSQLFLYFRHSQNFGSKTPFSKNKFLGPIDVVCPLPFLHSAIWTQTFLTAPRVHQCHVTVNGKSRSLHNIFQNAFPTFFVLPTFTKLGSKIPFSKKQFLGPIDAACPFHYSNFSDRAVNGKSRSPHNIFQHAFPTFPKHLFQKKSSSAQYLPHAAQYIPHAPPIPSPHVINPRWTRTSSFSATINSYLSYVLLSVFALT